MGHVGKAETTVRIQTAGRTTDTYISLAKLPKQVSTCNDSQDGQDSQDSQHPTSQLLGQRSEAIPCLILVPADAWPVAVLFYLHRGYRLEEEEIARIDHLICDHLPFSNLLGFIAAPGSVSG